MKKVIAAIACIRNPCILPYKFTVEKASTDGSTLISYAADSYALMKLYHCPQDNNIRKTQSIWGIQKVSANTSGLQPTMWW
jgi:hypothetical protein